MQHEVLLKPLLAHTSIFPDHIPSVYSTNKVPCLLASSLSTLPCFTSCSNASLLLNSAFLGMAVAACRTIRQSPLRRQGTPGGLVETPQETYESLVKQGETNSTSSNLRILHSSFMGGCYVGMSSLLSLTISGNLIEPSLGLEKFVHSALFPVSLLFVLQTGAQLFSGNTATMTMALFERKIKSSQVWRVWLFSFVGNLLGCLALAWVASFSGLLSGGTAAMAAKLATEKCGHGFGQTLVKAILCNWLLCMAVWLSTSAKDLTGKMVGVWFPISMFIAIGLEHSVVNLFVLPLGFMAGAPTSIHDMIFKNLVPVTIGNILAGCLIIAGGFSFAFGRLGSGDRGSFSGLRRIIMGMNNKDDRKLVKA